MDFTDKKFIGVFIKSCLVYAICRAFTREGFTVKSLSTGAKIMLISLVFQ